MLKEEHLKAYRINILEASATAHVEIKQAQDIARMVACEGCRYCTGLARHKHVLDTTTSELLELVRGLRPGARADRTFTKKMYPDLVLYRGFITWDGAYVDLPDMEHDTYRARYVEEHGPDRGHQLISIHSSALRNEVQFADRKLPPTVQQYMTLRDLMIDAEGLLSFRFMYGSTHPGPPIRNV